ncbi:uncharacterized protein UTRI_06338 [Ustilago trichophora]|uniref:Uncharacterized protein n=1 Tax=Ustilago trichophora TaxID=86804 RepID=A0A5C3EIL0_9BASI|nr:uncharacterized protein UTRI_06338 [Ustilago trichophora]
MADPPFQMPGHRWDPVKKRFFKILPGQPNDGSSDIALASSSRNAIGSKSRSKGNGKKGKQQQETWPDLHWKTIPRLPAIRQKTFRFTHKSSFAAAFVDPITLKQQGRKPVTATGTGEQDRTEATYSHLALFQARKPYLVANNNATVVDMQTSADGQTLLITSDVGKITRWSAVCRPEEAVLWLTEHDSKALIYMWNSTTSMVLVFTDADGATRRGGQLLKCSRSPYQRVPTKPVTFRTRKLPDLGSDTTQSVVGSVTIPSQTITSLTVSQTLRADSSTPQAKGPAEDGEPENSTETTVLAVSTGTGVQIHVFVTFFVSQVAKVAFSESDIMATAFDLSGGVLYCGTRSGLVLAWGWRRSAVMIHPVQDHLSTILQGTSSVTNLRTVSSDELLVVRINGEVQLFDTTMGQVKRQYQGHVNSYDFKLGFAVDPELRLLALAGLDRRVRVWSLDSPLPLGTAMPELRSHCAQESKAEDTQLDDIDLDESNSETFRQFHPAQDGKPAIVRGATLGSIVFPKDVRALHWHPRYPFEGSDPVEVHAVRRAVGVDYSLPQQRWKDLFVAAGDWVYQFRWP